MTFLVIDQVFLILIFFRFSVSLLYQMSYMTLSSQQKAFFQQRNSLTTPIFPLFKLSRPSHNTTSQNIRGDQCMGCPPTSNSGGTTPQSPLGLRPCTHTHAHSSCCLVLS